MTLDEALTEVAELRARVQQLEQPQIDIPLHWGLTRSEVVVATLLFNHELVDGDMIVKKLYEDRTKLPENLDSLIYIFIMRVRQKLAAHGITIHNRRGQGWYLDPETRDNFGR